MNKINRFGLVLILMLLMFDLVINAFGGVKEGRETVFLAGNMILFLFSSVLFMSE